MYAYGGYSHVTVGGNEDGKPTQSFSGERQYVYRASSGGEFGEGKLPAVPSQPVIKILRTYPYLILTPSSSTASGCLLSVLLNTKIVSINGINRNVVGLSHMGGSIHLVRWCRHDGH